MTLPSANAAPPFLVAALLLCVAGGLEGARVEGCHLTVQHLAALGLPGGLNLLHLD
jgi:hypothetical protein